MYAAELFNFFEARFRQGSVFKLNVLEINVVIYLFVHRSNPVSTNLMLNSMPPDLCKFSFPQMLKLSLDHIL